MPERPLTIATYALGASLCAISLLYVFGPTFALDGGDSGSSSRRRIVGLENPANMCFCNSVLQALANSPELRRYLIRETHRRRLDGSEVYRAQAEDAQEKGRAARASQYKLQDLQDGIVTRALKLMLDKLNERPIYRKTISAFEFIVALETAFGTRISRQQQDAQEFLQLVLERLDDEYHAGARARNKFRDRTLPETADGATPKDEETEEKEVSNVLAAEIFPFEGKLEAHIECQACGFRPKPATSTFVTLTMNVPQVSQTSLNKCLDAYLKDERIEDFKCARCRLVHAKAAKQRQLERTTDADKMTKMAGQLALIERALEEDPERELPDAQLPDLKHAPSRTIIRYFRIATFPRVLAVHLSRSIYSAARISTKNMARVSFPESLAVGGLVARQRYRLSSVVMHKGGHNSGHYETFRRQVPAVPFSTPHSLGTGGVYSRRESPNPSVRLSVADVAPLPVAAPAEAEAASLVSSGATQLSPASSLRSTLSSQSSRSLRSAKGAPRSLPPTSAPRDPDGEEASDKRASSVYQAPSEVDMVRLEKRRRKQAQRWWRVSDERVKECRTADVLAMQREVYLLFYEIEPGAGQ
jgi:ubiquitin carboxyl-terminal hydrolase 16